MSKPKNAAIESVLTAYAHQGIQISLMAKHVKHINFRLKSLHEPPYASLLTVSYPMGLPTSALRQALKQRLAWAVQCQQQQQAEHQQAEQQRQASRPKLPHYVNDIDQLAALTLDSEVHYWGEKYTLAALLAKLNGGQSSQWVTIDLAQTLVAIYQQAIQQKIAERQPHWQAIVGKQAKRISPYRMKTRWGSCSPTQKTIRLSSWLAQFSPPCFDYVLVHELCHLHEANHSPRFWQHVANSMPDYRRWHEQLKRGQLTDTLLSPYFS